VRVFRDGDTSLNRAETRLLRSLCLGHERSNDESAIRFTNHVHHPKLSWLARPAAALARLSAFRLRTRRVGMS